MLDPNIRRKLWGPGEARQVLRDLTRRCDIVLPGSEEAELLTDKADPATAARALLAMGPSLVVVKRGAHGATAVTADGVVHGPAVPLTRIVDPVGAGDAFAAGLLAGWLRDLPIDECLRLANTCGGLAMTVPGDIEAMPRWADVLQTRTSGAGDVHR